MTWQSIISDAAVQCFLRSGKVPVFALARGDLAELCAEVMGGASGKSYTRADVERDIAGVEGFMGLRCQVHCAPLDRAVAVDEWVGERRV